MFRGAWHHNGLAISRSKPGRLTFSVLGGSKLPRIHRSISGIDAASAGSLTFILLAKCHRHYETGGPPSGKQRPIGTSSWTRERELNIQAAIITAGDTAAPPARSMILRVPHLHCFLD